MKVDGYKIQLEPHIYKMRLTRVVYINGFFKGIWLNGDCEEARRFMRVKESYIFPQKYRTEMLRIYGKRRYNQRKEDFEKKLKSYHPDWTSFSSFKRHLIANNKEIELIK